MPLPPHASCPTPDCAVVELRQYTLHPGRRDALIALFERELLETQEQAGMRVLGQFRDLDGPDRFVWMRGFSSMQARHRALQAFYDGPAWAAHRAGANATMVDSDDVLLLRPAWPSSGLAVTARPTPPSACARGLLALTVFHLREGAGPELLGLARSVLSPALLAAGATSLGWYVTEEGANTFVRLPVREGERVLVAAALFPDPATFDTAVADRVWAPESAPTLQRFLARPPQQLRLAPTSRSAIRA